MIMSRNSVNRCFASHFFQNQKLSILRLLSNYDRDESFDAMLIFENESRNAFLKYA